MPGLAQGGFTIKDLGVIPGQPPGAPGGNYSNASGINQVGWTAGVSGQLTSYGASTASQAAMATSGTFQGVSVPMNASSSFATSINGLGSIAGGFVDAADHNTMHAFMTTSTGQAVDLGTLNTALGQGRNAQANGINSGNEVVGTGVMANGVEQAFHGGAGGLVAINPLIKGGFSMGNGINDQGTVVGTAQYQGQVVHAFVADSLGNVTDLSLRNAVGGFNSSTYGMAINASGFVAGYGSVNGDEHAFLAPPSGPLIDLGTVDGKESSYAYGLNSQHQVVGMLDDNGTGGSAFLWDQSQGMINLSSLLSASDQAGWQLVCASGINDADQISGEGYINGQLHGFLLNPVAGEPLFTPNAGLVPEPSSILLCGIAAGVAGVSALARLRRGRTAARAGV